MPTIHSDFLGVPLAMTNNDDLNLHFVMERGHAGNSRVLCYCGIIYRSVLSINCQPTSPAGTQLCRLSWSNRSSLKV